MSSPNAAQRVYYRVEQDLNGSPGTLELTGIPIKGLIRRLRIVADDDDSVVEVALGESAFPLTGSGRIDVIMSMSVGAVTSPYDLFADTLTDSLGVAAPGNEGVPFQLTPSSTGSTTGSLFLSWTNSEGGIADLQITIEPLVP